ncbi:MAG: glucosamine-6-phosphate isomerase [Spirochaetia bacterium]
MRKESKVAKGWWDYTTLDDDILDAAANLSAEDLLGLARPGFEIRFFDTLEEFYTAEAMEYVKVWSQSTADNPKGICGPIGPTEQLPLVARIVNDLELDVRDGHFWGMDEWYVDAKAVSREHPLSFAKADLDLCFNRIDKKLRMPDSHLHFLTEENVADYTDSYDQIDCRIMQGGQGEVKHWAFNDPLPRTGKHADTPPSPEEYRKLSARVVDLHPMTLIQNARTSGGGVVQNVPSQALTVGPVETWKSGKVSIWHAGGHDNPFGMRLTALMISRKIVDSAVPMSLLADHPDVRFSYYRPGIGTCQAEMH